MPCRPALDHMKFEQLQRPRKRTAKRSSPQAKIVFYTKTKKDTVSFTFTFMMRSVVLVELRQVNECCDYRLTSQPLYTCWTSTISSVKRLVEGKGFTCGLFPITIAWDNVPFFRIRRARKSVTIQVRAKVKRLCFFYYWTSSDTLCSIHSLLSRRHFKFCSRVEQYNIRVLQLK